MPEIKRERIDDEQDEHVLSGRLRIPTDAEADFLHYDPLPMIKLEVGEYGYVQDWHCETTTYYRGRTEHTEHHHDWTWEWPSPMMDRASLEREWERQRSAQRRQEVDDEHARLAGQAVDDEHARLVGQGDAGRWQNWFTGQMGLYPEDYAEPGEVDSGSDSGYVCSDSEYDTDGGYSSCSDSGFDSEDSGSEGQGP